MHEQIGPVIFGALSVVFASYGVRELALAYKTAALRAWSEKAVPGAAGVLVAAVFAAMTLQMIG